ncbi:MAG: hypothetical protein AB7I50_01490 [Vicinamibacterales bacterium]
MGRATPALLVVFLLVLQRWIESRAGWPEWITFPGVALVGVFLIDRLVLTASGRLCRLDWLANAAVAAAAAVGLLVVSR